jgi:hypothetical protein
VDSKGAQLLGRNFVRRGRISCLEKLAEVPEVGVWRFRESDEGWYKNFEAIAKLEMFEVGRGQASRMMKSRLAYSKEVAFGSLIL